MYKKSKASGKLLSDELNVPKEKMAEGNGEFVDVGRLKLNRKKQQEGIESPRNLLDDINHNLRPIFAGAAISGLFAIFYDGYDYFRIKNIPDSEEARKLLKGVGLEVYGTILSMKQTYIIVVTIEVCLKTDSRVWRCAKSLVVC